MKIASIELYQVDLALLRRHLSVLRRTHLRLVFDASIVKIISEDGKSVGLPVCELLGGSTETPKPMISSIYAGDREEMRQRVAEHRAPVIAVTLFVGPR